MIKGKVVLIPFPFDDLSGSKVRPAVCLTNKIGQYNHVILAMVTSKIPTKIRETDYVINRNHQDFTSSGLHKESTVKLDHLVTVRTSVIKRELGKLSSETQNIISEKVCHLLKASKNPFLQSSPKSQQ